MSAVEKVQYSANYDGSMLADIIGCSIQCSRQLVPSWPKIHDQNGN